MIREARALLRDEAKTANSRELAMVLTKLDEAELWRQRDMQLKTPVTNTAASGIDAFHEHDLRGKVATDMDDPVAAQKLLGHKNMGMTEDYIKARQTEVVQPHTRKTK